MVKTPTLTRPVKNSPMPMLPSKAQKALPDMAKDPLPDGNYRTFVVNVRDEAGQTVVRAALSLMLAEGPFDD
ncbi:DUF6894 family protein [Microvirga zambiensis]|uniref:DUF6894 family protein n=1 Tax=Microvirga zambiensis TaxID=1402137 RepID=UPI003CCD26BF